jgi:hypothetical protein
VLFRRPKARDEPRIPNLQVTYAAYGTNKRFVLASLSIDEDTDKLQNFVQQKKMMWFQGNLPGGWDSPVLKAWGVHGIPSIFLIDPNGRVVAASLRGAAIKDAVSRALSGS